YTGRASPALRILPELRDEAIVDAAGRLHTGRACGATPPPVRMTERAAPPEFCWEDGPLEAVRFVTLLPGERALWPDDSEWEAVYAVKARQVTCRSPKHDGDRWQQSLAFAP